MFFSDNKIKLITIRRKIEYIDHETAKSIAYAKC